MHSSEVIEAVARAISQQTAEHWQDRFAGHDVCVSRVVSLEEATRAPHFATRGLFDRTVKTASGTSLAALPVPVADGFRRGETEQPSPALGEHNQLLDNRARTQ
jgi:crotonobetainyl-CoA:carnitine CoA-transferase CaiB-like acyl-CoA transferase